MEPPDPIPNSDVKRALADVSVGPPHAKVGHRQGLPHNPASLRNAGLFFCGREGKVTYPPLVRLPSGSGCGLKDFFNPLGVDSGSISLLSLMLGQSADHHALIRVYRPR